MIKIILSFSIILLFFAQSSAQTKEFRGRESAKIVLETNAQFGTIFKHSSKFLPDVTEFTYNFEASLSVRTLGNKAWQRKLHYPETGVTILHSQFGNDEIFGSGTGIFPHVKFFMNRNKIADSYFRVGTGLAYINKNYHPISNPTNNVIGAKLNNITQLRFGADFHIHPKVDLVFALNFTHFSNARVQSPNLGINIPGIVAGIRYAPSEKLHQYNTDSVGSPEKKNEYNYRFSVGINDNGTGGPKYPIYTHALYYSRYTSPANKFLVGASYAVNIGEYDFMRIQAINRDKNQKRAASDFSLFVGDEILLGNVGLPFMVGVYLSDKNFNSAPVYAKLGVNYYFLDIGQYHRKMFIGVNLKTHYSVAEFVEIGAGFAF